MLQMLTNESQKDVKTCYVNFRDVDSRILKYLEVTIYKTSTCDSKTYRKIVNIMEGLEYIITYFDPEMMKKYTITGMVESFSETANNASSRTLTIKCLPETPRGVKDIDDPTIVRGMPRCTCVYGKQTGFNKYSECIRYTIPLANISDIIPIPPECDVDPKDIKHRKGYKVMLLGLSATTLRAIVINLKLFADDSDDAIREIDLEIGKIYNILHYDHHAKALFEFTGKLVNIIETNNPPIDDTIVRESSVCKKEIPGVGNSIYTSNEETKEDYLSSENIRNDIKLVFDTSETFNGVLESIMLSSIRDCEYVSDGDDSGDDSDDEIPEDFYSGDDLDHTKPKMIPGDGHRPPHIEMQSGSMVVNIDPITGKVDYTNITDGPTAVNNHTSLQEILDFFFGVTN